MHNGYEAGQRDKKGLLFLGMNLIAPSHLWMRRMLEEVGDCVTTLATTSDSIGNYRRRFRCICLGNREPVAFRIRRRAMQLCRIPLAQRRVSLLKAALQADRTDVVFVHFLPREWFHDVLCCCDKPVFVHCHGYDVTWDLRRDAPGRLGEPAHKPDYVDRVRKLSDHVMLIANSMCTRDKLLSIGVRPERILVKYLGVEVTPDPPARKPLPKAITILYLGNLVDFKGSDLVLRAFDIACSRGLKGRLIVAGDGVLRITCELLRARSRYRDRIAMLGSVNRDEGERLRCEADVFTAHNCIGPIRRQEEAFGVSIVEAMVAALPVITGRSGAVVETVEHRVQGILVEPGDVEAHADAFLELERDPQLRIAMGLAGWKRAKELFSLERERDELRRILGLPPNAGQIAPV